MDSRLVGVPGIVARLVVLTDMFDDRMLAPVVAVSRHTATALLPLGGPLHRNDCGSAVAVVVFATTMVCGDQPATQSCREDNGPDSTDIRVARPRSHRAQHNGPDRCPRIVTDRTTLRWIARLPSQTLGQPEHHVRTILSSALAWGISPISSGQKVPATVIVLTSIVLPGNLRREVQRHLSCPMQPLRQPVPDPQQAASEVGPIRARPPGRKPLQNRAPQPRSSRGWPTSLTAWSSASQRVMGRPR